MPIQINGRTYYRTAEMCRKSGISRATLYRWLRTGMLEKSYKDRRGWRLFTQDDLNRIQAEATRVEVEYASAGGKHDKY